MFKKLVIASIILLFSQNAMAAIAYVNNSGGHDFSGSSFSSIATAALSVTTGNLIVVTTTMGGGNSVSSVTDTAGNTYLHDASCAVNLQGTQGDIWYAKNIIGNAANTVTVNYSAGSQYVAAQQTQYSGASTTSPFESCTTGQASTATSVTTGSFSPAASGNVNVVTSNVDAGGAYTAGTNYTIINSVDGIMEHRLSAPAGAQTASISFSPAADLNIVVATFISAAGGTTSNAFFNGVVLRNWTQPHG